MKRTLIALTTLVLAVQFSAALLLGLNSAHAIEPAAPTLLETARNGDLAQVRDLLERGANVDHRDAHDNTALHLAAGFGHTELAALLIEHGADIDARGRIGNTPLHLAAQKNHAAIARLLVDGGADTQAHNHYRGTALKMATEWGHRDVLNILQKNDKEQELAGIRTVQLIGLALLAAVAIALLLGVRAIDPNLRPSFGHRLE